MDLTDITTMIATAGGVQGTIELLKWWSARKFNCRKQEADVVALESENGRKQIDWLESRLAERDAKIDALYSELRKEQAERIQEINLRHEVELRLTDAEARKCCVRGCSNRIPPSEF